MPASSRCVWTTARCSLLQSLRHTNVVRVSVCEDDRVDLARTGNDLTQRVDHHWIVLRSHGIDERDPAAAD